MPAPLAYAMAGLWIRFRSIAGHPVATFFHAHNTSGYGLTAWLSGVPYGVTTYGTEIFDADNRGFLYRVLIKKILRRANFVTSSSPRMTSTLVEKFSVNSSKVCELYLGVSPVFQYSDDARERSRAELGIPQDAIVWIVNRRMHEIYRVLETIYAFNDLSKNNIHVHLILIEGDADQKYAALVSAEAKKNPNIHIIRGFMRQDVLRDWLCAADFAISVPRSDQLSSSILEAMQCNVVPVLGMLPSYQAVGSAAEWVDMSPHKEISSLTSMFMRTANFSPADMKIAREAVKLKIKEINNPVSISNTVLQLYKNELIN